MQPDESKSIVQEIFDPILSAKGVRLLIKRDDLTHPEISGNKWRKLKYNLEEARNLGHQSLLTFGGAFSNHILAVASAGKEFGFETIGVIRGEEKSRSNPTLSLASEKGMKLHFISRQDYKEKDKFLINQLNEKFGEFYFIPEGGTNCLAIKGCQELIESINEPFNVICCAVGTGGTLAGIISSTAQDKKILGFSALKGDFLLKEVQSLIKSCRLNVRSKWTIESGYHFGGYAKSNNSLIDFINDFKRQQGVQLDPIYTGKMLFGLYDLVQNNYFSKGETVLAVHTGGLQGISGFNILHHQAIILE